MSLLGPTSGHEAAATMRPMGCEPSSCGGLCRRCRGFGYVLGCCIGATFLAVVVVHHWIYPLQSQTPLVAPSSPDATSPGRVYRRRLSEVPLSPSATHRVLQWEEAQTISPEEEKLLASLWGSPSGATSASPPVPGPSGSPRTGGTEQAGAPSGRPERSASPLPRTENDGQDTEAKLPKYRVIGGGTSGDYEVAQEYKPAATSDDPVDLLPGEESRRKISSTTTTTAAPLLRFRQCQDAKARGYSMPFACCTIKSGDFYDARIWHCGRVPTSLDAVFVRHFVRLPSERRSKVQLRALWVIKSLEPNNRAGSAGILRSGDFPHGRCSPDALNANVSPTELRSIRETFRSVIQGDAGRASLSDICSSLQAAPFTEEADFTARSPTVIVIREPGEGALRNGAEDVALTGVERPDDFLGSYEEDEEGQPPEKVENNLPRPPKVAEVLRPPAPETVATETTTQTPVESPPVTRPQEPSSASPSPVVPFGFGRAPQPPTSMATSRLPQQAVPNAYMGRPRVLGQARLLQRQRKRFVEPLAFSGPTTLRVEHGAALLLLSNASVVMNGHIRNDGTFFVGESEMENCNSEESRRETSADAGSCRIPSLETNGSLVAREPINVHWLQLSQLQSGGAPPDGGVSWFGRIGYPLGLPGDSSSTLTLFGQNEIDKILPGFSFSFRRLGFPPYPAPPRRPRKTTLRVKDSAASVDLMIYVDVFDDDGFIDCCEKFYDRYPAVFEVGGVNIKFGPFSGFHKNIGDGTKLSEQIVIRANRIINEETFAGLPALIPMEDAVMTNSEALVKQAGTNRDIVYFQCYDECRISNQIFKAKKGYKYVQVTRELPDDRPSPLS